MNWPLLRFFYPESKDRCTINKIYGHAGYNDHACLFLKVSGAIESFECDVFLGPCHWNTSFILKEINRLI